MKSVAVRCLLSAVLLFVACKSEDKTTTGGGNPDRGRQLVDQYGCTACHIIPDVKGPRGMVGPPLEHFGSRNLIAGKIPNTPDNLMKWLQNPQAFDPANAMPNLGITPADSKDLAAFLYMLK